MIAEPLSLSFSLVPLTCSIGLIAPRVFFVALAITRDSPSSSFIGYLYRSLFHSSLSRSGRPLSVTFPPPSAVRRSPPYVFLSFTFVPFPSLYPRCRLSPFARDRSSVLSFPCRRSSLPRSAPAASPRASLLRHPTSVVAYPTPTPPKSLHERRSSRSANARRPEFFSLPLAATLPRVPPPAYPRRRWYVVEVGACARVSTPRRVSRSISESRLHNSTLRMHV